MATVRVRDREEDCFDQGYLDAGDNYIGDVDDDTYLIHRSQRQPDRERPYIPKEIWDKVPEESRSVILELHPTKTTVATAQRKVHFHDRSVNAGIDLSDQESSNRYWRSLARSWGAEQQVCYGGR
jgi:hypothetical protein